MHGGGGEIDTNAPASDPVLACDGPRKPSSASSPTRLPLWQSLCPRLCLCLLCLRLYRCVSHVPEHLYFAKLCARLANDACAASRHDPAYPFACVGLDPEIAGSTDAAKAPKTRHFSISVDKVYRILARERHHNLCAYRLHVCITNGRARAGSRAHLHVCACARGQLRGYRV